MMLVQAYLPKKISDVKIIPAVESNTLNQTDSSICRPIAVFNSATKLIEKVILFRLADFLVMIDRQFRFKQNHSTDRGIFAFK